MINVEEVFLSCRDLLSKDKSGYFSTDEFNARSKRAEEMLWNFYVKHYEEHGIIPDGMHPFNALSTLSLDSTGKFTLPDDFARRTVCWYRKVTTNTGGAEPTLTDITLSYLEKEEVVDTLDSAIRGPNLEKKRIYYTYSAGVCQVYPSALSGIVRFEYLRLPTYAERAFNLDATNIEEDYDSGNSIHYEWPAKEKSNIEDLILMQYGVMLKNTPILNWAAGQVADSRNIQKI